LPSSWRSETRIRRFLYSVGRGEREEEVKGCCVFGEGERDEGMTVARARV
jgi:hypothetical protein